MDTVTLMLTLSAISLTRFKSDLHEASAIDSERQRFRSVELLWFWLCGQLLFLSLGGGVVNSNRNCTHKNGNTTHFYRPQTKLQKDNVHRGGCLRDQRQTPPPGPEADTPLWTEPPPGRRLLQRTIHILLECILVNYAYSSVQKSRNCPHNRNRNSVNLL